MVIVINLFIKFLLCTLFIFSLTQTSCKSKPYIEYHQIISSAELSPGVTHTNEIIYNFMNKKLNHQNINYIEMDLSLINKTFSLMCHKSKNITNGKETLKDQVLQEQKHMQNIIAATNGDFFNFESGIPTCNNIVNGEIFSTSINDKDQNVRPSFAIFEDNSIEIDHFCFIGNITLINKNNKKHISIDSINRNDYIENTINIFNCKNNEFSTIYFPKEKEDALIILITPDNLNSSFYNGKKIKGKISEIIHDPSNTYKLANNQIAIIAYNEKKFEFSEAFVNMDIEIDLNIKKNFYENSTKINHLLTGHEFILYDGIIPDKDYFNSLWNTGSVYSQNHRTALALTSRNTLILLTVDKKNEFKGMSLPELGHFFISKGAYKAINLDGGGSTSMMIREPGIYSLKNVNLSREDRKISNSLMIKNLLPYTYELKDFHLHDSKTIHKNEIRKLTIIAYDINLNPIDIYTLPNLKLTSDVGIFDPYGTFYPIKSNCQGKITIEAGNIIKTYEITITE